MQKASSKHHTTPIRPPLLRLVPVLALGVDAVFALRALLANSKHLGFLPRVGIGARSQLDPEGSPLQLEGLDEDPFEVALVRSLDMVRGAAVDHHDGRIGPTLVRIAQL